MGSLVQNYHRNNITIQKIKYKVFINHIHTYMHIYYIYRFASPRLRQRRDLVHIYLVDLG